VSEERKKFRIKIPGDNPLIIYNTKNGMQMFYIINKKEAIDVVDLGGAKAIRFNIPDQYMPHLLYLVSRRIIAQAISKGKEAKKSKVDIDEILESAKEIKAEEEDIASLMK